MTDATEQKLLFDNGKYTLGVVTEMRSHSKEEVKMIDAVNYFCRCITYDHPDWYPESRMVDVFEYWGA